MKGKIYILTSLLLWFAAYTKAQQVTAFSKADTNSITIGDQIGFDIGIKLPENFSVEWPQFADTLSQHIEIIKKSNVDTSFSNNTKTLVQHLTVTSFDSGYFKLPPVKFVFHHKNDTTKYTIETEPVYLNVYVPEVDTTKPFRPIVAPFEEPVTIEEVLPWVLGIIALLGLIIFGIYYYKRRKANKPVFGKKPKPLPPPHVEALDKLENLRLKKLWQAGKIKEYHSELTDIMRVYLKRRFNFDAVEMTTGEIFEELKSKKDVNDTAYEKLKRVFELADLVKFAKAQPTALENDQSIFDSMDFVNETKFVPRVNENTKEEDKQ
jgi:hypothetical protein